MLVGPGAGLAPFRGFLHDKEHLVVQGNKHAFPILKLKKIKVRINNTVRSRYISDAERAILTTSTRTSLRDSKS